MWVFHIIAQLSILIFKYIKTDLFCYISFPHIVEDRVGYWKYHFTIHINEKFEKLYPDKLKDSDLTFDFDLWMEMHIHCWMLSIWCIFISLLSNQVPENCQCFVHPNYVLKLLQEVIFFFSSLHFPVLTFLIWRWYVAGSEVVHICKKNW